VPAPEDKARETIDDLSKKAHWQVADAGVPPLDEQHVITPQVNSRTTVAIEV